MSEPVYVDTKGRFEATVSPAAIDVLEREGKKVVFSLGVRENGSFDPCITVIDWPEPTPTIVEGADERE